MNNKSQKLFFAAIALVGMFCRVSAYAVAEEGSVPLPERRAAGTLQTTENDAADVADLAKIRSTIVPPVRRMFPRRAYTSRLFKKPTKLKKR